MIHGHIWRCLEGKWYIGKTWCLSACLTAHIGIHLTLGLLKRTLCLKLWALRFCFCTTFSAFQGKHFRQYVHPHRHCHIVIVIVILIIIIIIIIATLSSLASVIALNMHSASKWPKQHKLKIISPTIHHFTRIGSSENTQPHSLPWFIIIFH